MKTRFLKRNKKFKSSEAVVPPRKKQVQEKVDK